MYMRIMAAIDDSFATSKVLDTAIDVARKYGAKLAICHALDVTILAQGTAATWLSNGVSQVENALRHSALVFVDQAASVARAAGLDVEVKLVESEQAHVAEMLANAASEWQAGLLVAGTHGRHGVDRFFVGSVAEQLVRKARTSLLLVRSD